MNKYAKLMKKQQEEYNELPIYFAITDKSFEKMLNEMGLTKNDGNKITSIGCNGFIKTTDIDLLRNCQNKSNQEIQEAIESDKTGEGFICEMFRYEMSNCEFGYTQCLNDTIDSTGFTFKQIKESKTLSNGLQIALKKYGCDQEFENYIEY